MLNKLFIFLWIFEFIIAIEFKSFNDNERVKRIEIPDHGSILYHFDEDGLLKQLQRFNPDFNLIYEVFYNYENRVLVKEVVKKDHIVIENPIDCSNQKFEPPQFKPQKPLQYTFNNLNQLIKASNEDIEIEINYDELSNRSKKIVKKENLEKTYFFGNVEGLEIALFDEDMNLIELMIPGIQILPFFSKPSVLEIKGEIFVPQINNLLNITKLIHFETGREIIIPPIDPFGILLLSENLISSFSYRFKPYDCDLKLVYFGYRYYDPNLKSFINEDPFGNIQDSDLKAYCFNQPEKFIDPDGRFFFIIPLISSDSFQDAIEKTLTTLISSIIYDVTQEISTWIDRYEDQKRTEEFLKIQKGEKPSNFEPAFQDTSPLDDVRWQDF